MRKRITFSLVIIFFISLILYQGCGKKEETDIIKIGAVLPLTGSLSFMGELERHGMEIARETLERDNISLFYEDSEGNATKGLNAAQNLLNINNVKILITTGTAVSRSVSSLHNRFSFLQSAFCMDPSIQEEDENVLRLYYGMEQEAKTILSYLKEINQRSNNLSSNAVGILSVNHQGSIQQVNDYFKPGLKELGIPIQFIDTYEFSQKDFKNIIAKISNTGIRKLIIIGYGFVYPEIFKNLEQYNLLKEIDIIGGWGFIANKNLTDNQLEGIVVASPLCMISPNDKYKAFEKKYLEKYKVRPNFESALAYENVLLFYDAFNNVKEHKDLEKIRSYILGLEYDSILGEIKITEKGKMVIPMGLGKFVKGKLKPLY